MKSKEIRACGYCVKEFDLTCNHTRPRNERGAKINLAPTCSDFKFDKHVINKI
jgi:hypothetical protein